MKAVILVGGKGTRLAPLTDVCAKPMLPVANKAFIVRVLERLHNAGCTEAVLSSCYLAEDFRHLENLPSLEGMRVRLEIEEQPLGTGGAIGYAARDFDETFVVLNGDILSDFDIATEIARHKGFGAEATIQLTPVDDPSRFGVVVTGADSQVRAFIEKPSPGTAASNMINAGFYVCEPSMLKRIPPGREVSIERETFPSMVADGVLYASGSDRYWLDFGTFETYLKANLDVLAGKLDGGVSTVAPDAQIAADAQIIEPVVIAAKAVVGAGAKVGPGVALGENCHVGAGASVSNSVVLAGSSIGEQASVDHTIIGFDAKVSDRKTLGAGTVVSPGGAGPVASPGGAGPVASPGGAGPVASPGGEVT